MSETHERTTQLDALDGFMSAMQRINRYARSGAFYQNGQQVTRVQWMILRFLKRTDRATIGRLAERMNVRPSTMSQMLDRMEKEHWVARTQAPDDSRVRLITLTDEGLVFMQSVESAWQDRLLAPFFSLTIEERTELVKLLTKLANATVEREDRDR